MANPLEELRDMTLRDVNHKLDLSDDDFEAWLVTLGLLHRAKRCPLGDHDMILRWDNGRLKWVCRKRECRRLSGQETIRRGYLAETFFAHVDNRAMIKKIFHLSYFWIFKYGTMRRSMKEIDLSMQSVAHWWSKFRLICRRYFQRHRIQIGGPGIRVYIDEHFMSVRKNMRGRRVRRRSRWIFGGVEEGSNHSFMVPVNRRRAIDLLPWIQLYIRPGSIILSDNWRAYRQIRVLQHRGLMYRHLVVNHNRYFVDPITRVHTQNIENKWGQWKSEVRRCKGISDRQLRSKLWEFLWHERFGKDDAFFNFWTHIVEQFPVDR